MPTTLYLVRHGETPGNRLRRFQTYDTPLSDTGREQARRVADRLADEGPFDALYSSDLRRTVETATPIGARLGLMPVLVPALRELDAGDLKGTLYTDLNEREPGRLDRWIAGGGRKRWPGASGENTEDVLRRVSAFFDDAVARHCGSRVVAVSHGWALQVLMAYIEGADHIAAFAERRIVFANTAVTVVEVEADGTRTCRLRNCIAHLDGLAGTATGGAIVA